MHLARAVVVAVALVGATLAVGAHPAGAAGPTYPTWSGTREVTYCDPGGQPLAMTLFAPAAQDHPVPLVLQVHGGGWERGHRLDDLASSSTAQALVAAGFAVASIDYRLAPANPWPDQIDDVTCAVRYLRAQAGPLGIDPAHLAAWGSSAGGQLVALLGTSGAAFPGDGQWPDQPDTVAAVVDEFGPADLTDPLWPSYTAGIIRQVFGRDPGPSAALALASPADHVAPGDPPFLILQGTADRIVPATQSEELAARLQAAGDRADLVLVRGGGHGLGTPGESPGTAVQDQRIVDFLQQLLGR